jgi:hypothetical protein
MQYKYAWKQHKEASLSNYLYLKLAKASCFSFYPLCFFFYKIEEQEDRTVLPGGSSTGVWEVAGERVGR